MVGILPTDLVPIKLCIIEMMDRSVPHVNHQDQWSVHLAHKIRS